ncbi:MAG: hypothetical protein QFX38_05670 [Methanothermobacter sp.]|nr:hypothetical protein [Methanothermobacter sp.]
MKASANATRPKLAGPKTLVRYGKVTSGSKYCTNCILVSDKILSNRRRYSSVERINFNFEIMK